MKSIVAFTMLLLIGFWAVATTHPTLIFKNQYGEQTNGVVLGGTLVGLNGTTSIAANTIVSNLTSSSALPQANSYSTVSAKLLPTMLLTGFSAGAGTVASTDTVIQAIQKVVGNLSQLQNGQLTPTTETVSAAGAISTTIMESLITNASGSTFAATLAAPSSQDGQIKVIKAVTTMSHTITIVMTNISMSGSYTPTGTTTLTFTNVGDSAIFMAVGGKWVYLGGSAVAS